MEERTVNLKNSKPGHTHTHTELEDCESWMHYDSQKCWIYKINYNLRKRNLKIRWVSILVSQQKNLLWECHNFFGS